MKTFIIGEAGVNHNGSLKTAEELIDIAAAAGVDAVKFQIFDAEKLVSATAKKARYQVENTGTDETQLEMLKSLELSANSWRKIASYCRKKKMIFLCTPFDEKSADFLNELGVPIFKIPSGEITNKGLIQHIAAMQKPVILSTGMSFLEEVGKAVKWIDEVSNKKKKQLTLLHCVSNYPAAPDDINLLAMKTLQTAFGLPIGYSDHTLGIEIPIAAVAIGAAVIEKHFTISRNMKGPDHKASLELDELKAMVDAIRNVEKALGDGIKRPAPGEESTRNLARRSLVAVRNIKAGAILEKEDIAILRPGSGIPPEYVDRVIGLRVKRVIKSNSVICWKDLKDA